jgi:phage-related protein/predicted XRE-type DNA-binding protein
MKPIRFLGDSLKCLRDFPEDARQDAGYQLDKVQRGKQPDDFKPMPSISKGVEEIRVWDDVGIYRVIYTARMTDAVVVFHAFQKKNAGDVEARPGRCQRALRPIDERPKKMSKLETYDSVWDALADTPEQAANLRARAELMQKIAEIVQESGWTQTEAAARCGVTQPRISDLLRGRVSRFSLDALVNIATAIGRRVHVELEAA